MGGHLKGHGWLLEQIWYMYIRLCGVYELNAVPYSFHYVHKMLNRVIWHTFKNVTPSKPRCRLEAHEF